MTSPSPSAPSREDLLAGLDRLSQGRGLTYGERMHLRNSPDLAFIDARTDALQRQRRWQPVAIAGLFLFAVVLVFIAGGATLNPATWWPARPRGLTLLMCIPAGATPVLTYRTLSQKLGIYRALRAMAAPSPTA